MTDKYGVGNDPYCYPDSHTLINHLGITEPRLLEQAENELVGLTSQQIDFIPAPYTLHTWQQMHAALFADLYPFAGAIRTIDISKGGTRFCAVGRIRPQADNLFTQLASEHQLSNYSLPEFIPRLAHYYNELNVIHPFREGNGRSQRILFEQLVINAGYQADWSPIAVDEWRNANIAGYQGDVEAMEAIFSRCVKL